MPQMKPQGRQGTTPSNGHIPTEKMSGQDPVNGKKQFQQAINPKIPKNREQKNVIECGIWKIKRGVWKQEMEVKVMLVEEKLDILLFH